MIPNSVRSTPNFARISASWILSGSVGQGARMPSINSLLPESSSTMSSAAAAKTDIYKSIERLFHWLEERDYRAFDTFDGLNARFIRPFTFNNPLLRIVLQQGVRRFPLNLRPFLGVTPERSTKGMGFLARGFIRLYQTTGEEVWRS